MLRFVYFCLLFFITQLNALSLDEQLHKVESSLIVKDNQKAVNLAEELVEQYPEAIESKLMLIKAFCQKGDEIPALNLYLKEESALTKKKWDRLALEMIAWAVLNKTQDSPHLPILMNALYGISLTHDCYAIPFLLKQLNHSSSLVRALAVKMCSSYGDSPLKKQLFLMLKEEKVWYVRLEVLQAVGDLKIKEASAYLKEIIGSSRSLAEEKAAASIALLSMTDSIEDEELNSLLNSKRSGHRALACFIISYFQKWEKLSNLKRLLLDTSSEVRVAAIYALGMAAQEISLDKEIIDLLGQSREDPTLDVAIASSWASFITGEKKGAEKLASWALSTTEPERARLATAALAASGRASLPYLEDLLDKVNDPYARFNLARGLICHRANEKKACEVLADTLEKTEGEFLMWENRILPSFQMLAPSKFRHIEQIPNYPKMVDQMVRLEILSILSMRQHPQALESIRHFLEKSDWGLVAEASSLLLQEGDESHLDEIRKLLNDKEENIRLQAALILALVSHDEKAIPVLLEIYPKVEREQKIQILLALGHLGDRRSIPLFLKVLQEPFQQLKILSASCLIQCLYQ